MEWTVSRRTDAKDAIGITTTVLDIKLLSFVNGELNPIRQTLVEMLSENPSAMNTTIVLTLMLTLTLTLNISTNVCLTGFSSPFTNGSNFMSETIVVIPFFRTIDDDFEEFRKGALQHYETATLT